METPRLINSNKPIDEIATEIEKWSTSRGNCLLKIYGKKQIGKSRVIHESLRKSININCYEFDLKNGQNIGGNEFLKLVYEKLNNGSRHKLQYFIVDNLFIILIEFSILIVTNLFRLGIAIPSVLIIISLTIDFLIKKNNNNELKETKMFERIAKIFEKTLILYFNNTKYLDDSCKEKIEDLLHLSSGQLMIILEFDIENIESIQKFNFSNFYNVKTIEIEMLKLNDYKKFLRHNRYLDINKLSDNDIELLHKNSNGNLLFALNIASEKEIYFKEFYKTINTNELYILCSIIYYGNSIDIKFLECALYKNEKNSLFTKESFIQAFDNLTRKKIVYLKNHTITINNFVYDMVCKYELSEKTYVSYNAFNDFINTITTPVAISKLNSFAQLNIIKCGLKYTLFFEFDDYIEALFETTKSIYLKMDFISKIDYVNFVSNLSLDNDISFFDFKRFLIEESINLGEYNYVVQAYKKYDGEWKFSDYIAYLLSLSIAGDYELFKVTFEQIKEKFCSNKERYLCDFIELMNEVEYKSSKIDSIILKLRSNKDISMKIYALSLRCYSNVVFGSAAIEVLEEALCIFEKLNLTVEKGATHIALARKYTYLGEYKKSIFHLKQSKRMTDNCSIKEYFFINNISIDYILDGDINRVNINKLKSSILFISDKYEKIIVYNNIMCFYLIKNNRVMSYEYYKIIENLIIEKDFSPWFKIRVYYNFYKYAIKYDDSMVVDLLCKIQKIFEIKHEYNQKDNVNQICNHIINGERIPDFNPLHNILKSGYILGTLSYWGFIFNFKDIDLENY